MKALYFTIGLLEGLLGPFKWPALIAGLLLGTLFFGWVFLVVVGCVIVAVAEATRQCPHSEDSQS